MGIGHKRAEDEGDSPGTPHTLNDVTRGGVDCKTKIPEG